MGLEYIDKNLTKIADKIRKSNGSTEEILRSQLADDLAALETTKQSFSINNYFRGDIDKAVVTTTTGSFSGAKLFFSYVELTNATQLLYSLPSNIVALRGRAVSSISTFLPSTLKTLILDNPNGVVSISSSTYLQNIGKLSIYVPDDLVASYKIASNWSIIADKIFPLSDYEELEVTE